MLLSESKHGVKTSALMTLESKEQAWFQCKLLEQRDLNWREQEPTVQSNQESWPILLLLS